MDTQAKKLHGLIGNFKYAVQLCTSGELIIQVFPCIAPYHRTWIAKFKELPTEIDSIKFPVEQAFSLFEKDYDIRSKMICMPESTEGEFTIIFKWPCMDGLKDAYARLNGYDISPVQSIIHPTHGKRILLYQENKQKIIQAERAEIAIGFSKRFELALTPLKEGMCIVKLRVTMTYGNADLYWSLSNGHKTVVDLTEDEFAIQTKSTHCINFTTVITTQIGDNVILTIINRDRGCFSPKFTNIFVKDAFLSIKHIEES